MLKTKLISFVIFTASLTTVVYATIYNSKVNQDKDIAVSSVAVEKTVQVTKPEVIKPAVSKKEVAKPVEKKSYSYKIKGKTYHTLSTSKGYNETGTASWYGPGFHGKKTANGEIYNQNAMTSAHKTLPLGSKVKVTNLANNKTVILTVNDRGPYHGNRIIDLSKEAANQLGVLHGGTAKVNVQAI